ncbi:methyl-accepting chemotaxis protein [Candidatus Contubernalis alkaliaceticus]|uniref:methyl-accepting chemotaxis protein n=1 Tax=Candidatus Contubernalis alkaliaceticus TaxID=338645 RepID=UPI001F4C2F14|nr:methyl-accepting chemotaxis protein [Candidatus Contubernalis alkalaceticus]UNC91947.1 chemotaxis protein [Candidatus Contubernalis alkalaceticus]
MTKLVGKHLLEQMTSFAPYIKEFFLQEAVIGVVDNEKYLHYEGCQTFDLGIVNGDPVKDGSATHQAMMAKERILVEIPREIWGVAIKAISIPVFDEDDNVIGAIAFCYSVENQSKMQEVVAQFSSAFQQVNSGAQEIAAGAHNLANTGESLTIAAANSKTELEKTNSIIQMISKVAHSTKLLGLNAAIEAARSGEHGRGFAVVADEIHRLSDQSNSFAKEIESTLKTIVDSLNTVIYSIQETSSISEEQSAATQEIVASMQELYAQLNVLDDLAKYI